MKTALIFDPYDDYNIRIRFVKKALEQNGFKVSIFFSDFDHMKKEKVKKERADVIYIPSQPYKKNLSYARLHSHAVFAKDCVRKAEASSADLIYVMVPPNSMAKEFAQYKKKHPNVKIWFDVLDMWPESLPVPQNLKKLGALPLNMWRTRRDSYLKYGDYITPECDLFDSVLKKSSGDVPRKTIYLCQNAKFTKRPVWNGTLELLYCGSMNHILDIETLIQYLSKIQLPLHLHLIGDGESRTQLLSALDENKIAYTYHGLIYEESRKQEIYEQCHFGLDCMKTSVFVGLTMKSLDYMSHGLPLISNIQGDTKALLEKENIGFVLDVQKPVQETDLLNYSKMAHQTEEVFLHVFEESVILKQMNEVIREVL